MPEMGVLLERWRMNEAEVRRRMYQASTPRVNDGLEVSRIYGLK